MSTSILLSHPEPLPQPDLTAAISAASESAAAKTNGTEPAAAEPTATKSATATATTSKPNPPSAPRITVHHLNNSRSQRLLWLLEELSLSYEVKKWERQHDGIAPTEFKKIHNLGKFPVVEIEWEGKKIALAESGAIIEFLIENFGNGKLCIPPSDFEQRADYIYFLHYPEGSVWQPLFLTILFNRMPSVAPFFARPLVHKISAGVKQNYVEPRIAENFKFLDDHLAQRQKEGKEFFVGDGLTGADISISFPVEVYAHKLGKYPHVKKWLEKIKAREAYKKAAAKGDRLDFSDSV